MKILLTVPHAVCISAKARDCDRVAETASVMLEVALIKKGHDVTRWVGDKYRADVDLNRSTGRATQYREKVDNWQGDLLLDVHSFPVLPLLSPVTNDEWGCKVIGVHGTCQEWFHLGILDNVPANTPWVLRLLQCLIRQHIPVTYVEGSNINDITQRARLRQVPAVLLEFSENLSRAQLRMITDAIAACVSSSMKISKNIETNGHLGGTHSEIALIAVHTGYGGVTSKKDLTWLRQVVIQVRKKKTLLLVEAACDIIETMERSGRFNAGVGGVGKWRHAAVMSQSRDGASRRVGGVVMSGAVETAAPMALKAYERNKPLEVIGDVKREEEGEIKQDAGGSDTIGVILRGINGDWALATATGGKSRGEIGRISDAAVCGAGFDIISGTGAILCSGDGDQAIRHVSARDCLAQVKYGKRPWRQAMRGGTDHLQLGMMAVTEGNKVLVVTDGGKPMGYMQWVS